MAEVAQQKDKKSTRKVIIILLIIITIIIILLLLMRCGSSKKELKPVEENKEEQTVEVVEKKSTGFVDVVDKTVTPELKELFDKATSKDTNIKYEPIELIAKQENEDSIDYKFLAQEATGDDDPNNRHKFIIIVHEDFGGDVSLTEVEAVVDPDEDAHNKKTIVVDDGKATTTYYLVIFRDQYGNELQRTALPYGATPSYNGWLPEGFQHWDKEISPVTGNVNYYAVCYEVHHSEPSDEPVQPVVPTPTHSKNEFGFFYNSLYSAIHSGDTQKIDAVFTPYEDDNTSNPGYGKRQALVYMGPTAQSNAASQSKYICCPYDVDTATTPYTITLYTNISDLSVGKYTIEIGDTLKLKDFPAPESDLEFPQPLDSFINFFEIDSTYGYAYMGNEMVWLLSKKPNITLNGPSTINTIGSIPRTGEYFTRYVDSLVTLTIGPSITIIEPGSFQNLPNMTTLTFDPNSTLQDIGKGAFYKDKLLVTLNCPSSLRTIGDAAFQSCEGLTNLTLNDGLVTIGKNAFAGCHSLISINIPSSVRKIEENAFDTGSDLSSLTFASPTSQTANLEIASFAFRDKDTHVSSLLIPKHAEKLWLKCFYQFNPDNISFEAGSPTNWILYDKNGTQKRIYDLTVDNDRKDFFKGLTGDAEFSDLSVFNDLELGYFEIKHGMQPVR